MSTIDKLQEEIAKATSARSLKRQMLDDFFEEKQHMLFEAFKHARIGDTERLVDLHHQLKSVNALRVEIESHIETGQMARQMLDETEN